MTVQDLVNVMDKRDGFYVYKSHNGKLLFDSDGSMWNDKKDFTKVKDLEVENFSIDMDSESIIISVKPEYLNF